MPATAVVRLCRATDGAPFEGGGGTTRSVWSLGVAYFTGGNVCTWMGCRGCTMVGWVTGCVTTPSGVGEPPMPGTDVTGAGAGVTPDASLGCSAAC